MDENKTANHQAFFLHLAWLKKYYQEVTKLTKGKGFEIVGNWLLIVSNLQGITYTGVHVPQSHISNIHDSHPDPLFKKCIHDKIDKRN